jgi:GT2 family glycosyltransferase
MTPQRDGHTTTIVLSSYNQPNSLRLVFSALGAQDNPHFDVIVADDGSEAEVATIVSELCRTAPFKARFVTQEHNRYGQWRIQNEAASRTDADPLIFIDGDCVPFRNLVSTRRSNYRSNRFCAGGYVLVDLEEAKVLTTDGVARGAHEQLLTWRQKKRLYGKHFRNLFGQLIGRRYRPHVRGGNLSVPREALVAVNGFDEAYIGLGRGDADLGNRLRNAGCRGISLWNRAFVCHLDHGLDPRRGPTSAGRALDVPFHLARRDRVRAERGLDGHLRRPE